MFILQLVASSAWGINEPPAGLNPQGANMGKRRRPGLYFVPRWDSSSRIQAKSSAVRAGWLGPG